MPCAYHFVPIIRVDAEVNVVVPRYEIVVPAGVGPCRRAHTHETLAGNPIPLVRLRTKNNKAKSNQVQAFVKEGRN